MLLNKLVQLLRAQTFRNNAVGMGFNQLVGTVQGIAFRALHYGIVKVLQVPRSLKNLFRQDLLYRLNTVEITVPSLRERREDIPLLSEHFLQRYSRKYRKKNLKLPENIIKKLQKYDWPGNVRELQHSVERAVIMSDGKFLRSDDFQLSVSVEYGMEQEPDFNLENLEKRAIAQCLKKHGGNVSRAADELGLTRGALYRRIEKYGF